MHGLLANRGMFQEMALVALLELSVVPDNEKIACAYGVDKKVWLAAPVHALLGRMLSTQIPRCADRVKELRWADVLEDNNATIVAHNRRLCELYCPELMPACSLHNVRWFNYEDVLHLALAVDAAQTEESLAVDGLLDA